ncbi:lipid-A-disaccharide kinase [Formivibrio citricus]|uniref:Tetraacyldisaccharide 4'-kinase n=1 Tax=Formivibrio citricus TaxID=83765 RepID=A0A1I4ZRF2_9NEIS|nr:tetraacyldisaccharide 4'-kinase [Formivibrio citricus]SFN52633.1 lipid-A-disaccharide kinase [Formivibrio citricus]
MRWIERTWYRPLSLPALLLLPLAGLFALIAMLRRGLYRCGVLKVQHLPVPVVVVGNLTAGGAGKTPLTLHLAQQLAARGWHPGIVSRGYGGKSVTPLAVDAQTDPALCGDEPLLLARASGVPVFVCPDRFAAGQALLMALPDTDVILCDDGLQHYRLARDIELCVVDGARGFGNRLPLPAGPLREPVSRLDSADAVVVNGDGDMLRHERAFRMKLEAGRFYRLADRQVCEQAELSGKTLAAVCGIGNPARFFATLRELGLNFSEHPFPDHHAFAAGDLPDADLILVTEKDAVKLAALPGLGALGDKIRVLPVRARLEPDLAGWLEERIRHGCKAA